MGNYDHFEFTISDADDTDLVLVSVYDKRTDFTVRTALPNSGTQTASIMAFAGARFSRSALTAEELFKEIKAAGKNAQEKLANIFRNYGHASVADMAMLFAYIENVPKMFGTKFFYETSLGGGQERSSRFQDYSSSSPIPLTRYVQDKSILKTSEFIDVDKEFQNLQQVAVDNYKKYKDILTETYTSVYTIDPDNKQHMGALPARVFDTARYMLPSGVCVRSSLAYITSAREWARIISVMKGSKNWQLECLAQQLEVLFAPEPEVAKELGYIPEAPDLIRYTTADEATHTNLNQLKTYLDETYNFTNIFKARTELKYVPIYVTYINNAMSAGTKVVMQCIATLYPSIDITWLTKWLESLTDSEKRNVSTILYDGFNHHKQTGVQFRVNECSVIVDTAVCEGLDLNRHRAWGRFIPMYSMTDNYADILCDGYTLPLYLSDNEALRNVRVAFEADLQKYYQQLQIFIQRVKGLEWFPSELILELLPMAHIMKLWMHGSPKEVSYMTKLRVRPGGHINYRMLAYLIADKVAQSDPFLHRLALSDQEKPDPSSAAEFVDRS